MIPKPKIFAVPLSSALNWRGGGDWLFQEKSDGRWHPVKFDGVTLNAELMSDGELVVNDIVSPRPLSDRWSELVRLARGFPPGWRLCRIGTGGEYLEHVLASGGEGVVAKPWGTGYGVGWHKAKRLQVFYAVVTGLEPSRASVQVATLPRFEPSNPDMTIGDDGGFVHLGTRFEAVKIGSILKLEAYGQHASGKLREARLEAIL